MDTQNLDNILARLVQSRLLRIREDDSHYELMHDFLLGIIEPDEKALTRKMAIELIRQKLLLYKEFGIGLTRDEFAFIQLQRRWLVLDDEEKKMIASSQGRPFPQSVLYFLLFAVGSIGILFLLGIILSLVPGGYIPLFWASIIVFGYFGTRRGWASELLITFGAVFGMMLNTLINYYIPAIRDLDFSGKDHFLIEVSIFLGMIILTYQTPPRFAGKLSRKKLSDQILSGTFGALNGYLIMGTLWHALANAQYPFFNMMPPTNALQNIMQYIMWMPPQMIGVPLIYFLSVILFIIILVVLA